MRYAAAFSILLVTLPLAAQENKRPRPAWTSTLRCLAPLAREARSGSDPLTEQQAFFDGPFALVKIDPKKAESHRYLVPGVEGRLGDVLLLGFAQLLQFDDREAERCFREAMLLAPGNPLPAIGLTLANTDDPRRTACFYGLARDLRGNGGTREGKWIELLAPHLEGGRLRRSGELFSPWWAFARETNDPLLAGALLRELALAEASAAGWERTDEVVAWASQAFPQLPVLSWFGTTAGEPESALAWRSRASLHLEAGEADAAVEALVRSIQDDLLRLDSIGSVMPEASQNLGESASTLIHLLTSAGRHEEAEELAIRLLALPRDPFSVGTKWRRLDRDRSLWPAARGELARSRILRGEWESLARLPRGFKPRDKAEWFAWQAVAAREADGNYNPWLAALRRAGTADDIVENVEAYLLWKDGEPIEAAPVIPGVPPSLFEDLGGATGDSSSSLSGTATLSLPLDTSRPSSDFTLPDWSGKPVPLSAYRGEPVLVIFFLGGGCLHCVEQLNAFGPWAGRFREAGIELLAVSTDPVEILTQTLSDEQARLETFPIPIVSDHELHVFRRWSVYDEFDDRAIHGTFLLDPEGRIVWEEKGNAPYMHPDYLLEEAVRLVGHQ